MEVIKQDLCVKSVTVSLPHTIIGEAIKFIIGKSVIHVFVKHIHLLLLHQHGNVQVT